MLFAKLHPLLVHFPMALLFSGTLFQLLGKIQSEETLTDAGDFNIRFGFWTLFPVLAVGGLALTGVEAKGLARDFLAHHMRYAFAALFAFALWMLVQRRRGALWADLAHYLLLVAGLASVFMTGFYGGELVHRFGLPNHPGPLP